MPRSPGGRACRQWDGRQVFHSPLTGSTSDCALVLVLSLSSLQADEGQALVLLPGDAGGEAGEGGQHQALRDLCGLRDFPPVFSHLPCG